MSSTKPGILVVEDETVVAMNLEDDLLRLGYEVVGFADNGQEAVRLAWSRQPKLVLMDIKLRGAKDGVETAHEIRERSQVPIVFLTANSNQVTLARAKGIERSGYLTKPYRTSDLDAAIALALQQDKITQTLFAEKSWLNTILSSLSDGVVATDESGFVRYISPIAEALTGWSPAEAVGQPIEEVYRLATEDGQLVAECQLRRVLRTRRSVPRAEFLLMSKAGNRVFVEDAASPIQDTSGALIGAVSVFLDITERRKAERQREALRRELERSNEDLSRFSYSLAHDLAGPVRSVRAFGELLLRGAAGNLNEGQWHQVEIMTKAAAGMQRIVASMLEFAQVGHGALKRESIAVGKVIEAVRMSLAAGIRDSEATIQCEKLPVIEADRTQMEQLFQNLIANSIQYRKSGEALIVSISDESAKDAWVFAVTDNGQGIPPESLESIFEPLKRLHKIDVPGTGLGLSLCRRIVERHGGSIWAKSPGEGQGTTIYISLPRPATTIDDDSNNSTGRVVLPRPAR